MLTFLKSHLNDLFYEDTKDILNAHFVIQNKEDKNLLSAFLLELLDYQDVAQQVFLSALLEVDQAVLEHQTIGNFEKIKLLILTKGENAKIAEMAKKVLARIGHQLEYQQIIDLDYLRMVKEIPWDLHLVAGKIINEALTSLSGQQKTSFFTKLIENCKSAVTKKIQEIKDADELARQKEEPCLLNIGEIEETLGIFPVVLTALVTNFQVSQFEELFDAIIGLESNQLPILTEKLCGVGLSYINEYTASAESILKICESRINAREGIITPLVFLGGAAKHLKTRSVKFDVIAERIQGLAESLDPKFQNKLGKYISRLLIFFENPDELIENLLKQVSEEKEPLKIRAKCFAIAGIIRGCGVTFIEKHKIFDRIQTIVIES
jgi:hypothetical protein